MYYVYLLQCADGTIYTGSTNDLQRRFREHKNSAGGRYTRSHKVSKILYTEQFKVRSTALRREAQIKGWQREKKLNLVKFGKPAIK